MLGFRLAVYGDVIGHVRYHIKPLKVECSERNRSSSACIGSNHSEQRTWLRHASLSDLQLVIILVRTQCEIVVAPFSSLITAAPGDIAWNYVG